MSIFFRAVAIGALAILPGFAVAKDAALIVIGQKYAHLPNVEDAPKVAGFREDLEAAGFRVRYLANKNADAVKTAVEAFRDDAMQADRVMILITGHIVHSRRDSWLLTHNAEAVTGLNVADVGLPLGLLFDIAAEHPGQAVVMLAPAGDDIAGPGLVPGHGEQAPQGVTLMTGTGQRLVKVARDVLLQPGALPRQALLPSPKGIEVTGFVSDALPFLPAPPERSGPSRPPTEIDREIVFWNVVLEIATPEAYRAYLDRYPNGEFRAIAQAALDGAALDANARAQAAEAALGLDRNARREIQRNLSLLGHNPHGIDGIFGPGSRAAIKAWQEKNNHDPNGYLTAPQVRSLATAAQKRADKLATEAAARRAEEERRDTRYWRDTGQGGSEEGLRSYLGRYPDGLFADVADARLAEIEAAKRSEAETAERSFWDEVRASDTPADYQLYLDRFPRGLFTEAARARIGELTANENDTVIAAAKQEERRVAGNAVIRLLVENRLAVAGHDPGQVDGRFDKTTRRALRRFQGAQGLAVTGYVTQATMVRLLAVQ